ncbi:14 kDa phosphohistidine phosphatase-like isoform X2 [Lycorma delicatula]|uniref:14 kDa phosphohistidine phosphatase-like isoform X2 n=1 Tax=Lycorma delicatula TaxID=130591 RepID=UPI003F50F02A
MRGCFGGFIVITIYCFYLGGIRKFVNTMVSEGLAGVPEVDIDPEGTFKYILIKISQGADDGDPSKMIVRGNKRGPYHCQY